VAVAADTVVKRDGSGQISVSEIYADDFFQYPVLNWLSPEGSYIRARRFEDPTGDLVMEKWPASGNGAYSVNIAGGLSPSLVGTHNVAIAPFSGDQLTTGTRNFFLGGYAGLFATTGNDSVAVGYAAQQHFRGNFNMALGTSALKGQSAGNLGQGNNNCVIGVNAAQNALSFGWNTGIGGSCMQTCDQANFGNAIGFRSDGAASGSNRFVAIGAYATAGTKSIALGHGADASLVGSLAIGADVNGSQSAYTMNNLTTNTAPTGASTYLRVWLNGVEHRIVAQVA